MKLTLCGSARFEEQFHKYNERLTLAGHVVYSLAVFHYWYTDEEKMILDSVHKSKIANSDAIVVLNVDGYVGESTQSEINFAMRRSKGIYWLEPPTESRLSVEVLL